MGVVFTVVGVICFLKNRNLVKERTSPKTIRKGVSHQDCTDGHLCKIKWQKSPTEGGTVYHRTSWKRLDRTNYLIGSGMKIYFKPNKPSISNDGPFSVDRDTSSNTPYLLGMLCSVIIVPGMCFMTGLLAWSDRRDSHRKFQST